MKLTIFGTLLPAALLALSGCATPGDSASDDVDDSAQSGGEASVGEAQGALVASGWSYGGVIPGVSAGITPALSVYGGNMFMAYPGSITGQLYFNTFNGTSWSGGVPITGAYSSVAPALGSCGCGGGVAMPANAGLCGCPSGYNYGGITLDGPLPGGLVGGLGGLAGYGSGCDVCGSLYMAYPALGTGQLYAASYTGGAWGAPAAISGAYSMYSPAIMPYGNTLNMAYVGYGNQAFMSTFNNGAWGAGEAIPGACCNGAPSLGMYGGNMYMACGCPGSQDICGSSFNGTSWGAFGPISGVASPYSPALAAYGGGLNAFYVNPNRNLAWSTFNGGAWGVGGVIPGLSARAGVAVTPFGGGLAMVGPAMTGNQLWWSTYR